MERERSNGFRRAFTVAFLLFLVPVGQSLTFTEPNLKQQSKATVKIRRNPLLRSQISMILNFKKKMLYLTLLDTNTTPFRL